MATTKIFFQGTQERAVELANQLGDLIGNTNHPLGRAYMSAIGFGALSDIKTAYIVKSRGGRDEMGIQWPPLKPQTIANRRVGPKDLKTDPEIKERQKIVRREQKKLFIRFLLSLPEKEARSRAKQVAEFRATQQTGKTKVQTLGGRQVEILRDTGILFNSLSPGVLTPGTEHTAQNDDQIFQLNAGQVIVGTNVLYAATHNFGDVSRNIPRRQFLPDDNAQVPEVWWENWFQIAQTSLDIAFKILLDGG